MLTHVDSENRPTMVDVGQKKISERRAVARAVVKFPDEVLRQFDGGKELHTKKGPVFATAIIAGTMAAKKTSELIPFCHPLAIESCTFEMTWIEGRGVQIECGVRITGKTGVEMEALTGVSVAALTIYDMCKALSHEIEIGEISLVQKTGGKSDYRRPPAP